METSWANRNEARHMKITQNTVKQNMGNRTAHNNWYHVKTHQSKLITPCQNTQNKPTQNRATQKEIGTNRNKSFQDTWSKSEQTEHIGTHHSKINRIRTNWTNQRHRTNQNKLNQMETSRSKPEQLKLNTKRANRNKNINSEQTMTKQFRPNTTSSKPE